ncbi:hypothetical protein FJ366_00655 [Candidatus Dependentiae bacterium]|nr:hypothetical protein [Candidatus Dependentiae bacterium]
MRIICILFLLVSISANSHPWKITSTNGVIVEPSNGRFGDSLLHFCHGLYFAFKNGYTFFYNTFKHSDELVLTNVFEENPSQDGLFKKKIIFEENEKKALCKEEPLNTLICIPYFSESFFSPLFYVDWENPEFKKILKSLVTPVKKLSLIHPPKNILSVAVHIRRGGSFEHWKPSQKHGYHLYKIPELEFYIDQIKVLYTLFNEQPLYVHIFTDDEHPAKIAHTIKKALKKSDITIDYRRENNHHNTNVLEDFFSIMHFDALIRPDSNFSIMAEKLGDHAVIISPGDFRADLMIQYGSIKVTDSFKNIRKKYLILPQE